MVQALLCLVVVWYWSVFTISFRVISLLSVNQPLAIWVNGKCIPEIYHETFDGLRSVLSWRVLLSQHTRADANRKSQSQGRRPRDWIYCLHMPEWQQNWMSAFCTRAAKTGELVPCKPNLMAQRIVKSVFSTENLQTNVTLMQCVDLHKELYKLHMNDTASSFENIKESWNSGHDVVVSGLQMIKLCSPGQVKPPTVVFDIGQNISSHIYRADSRFAPSQWETALLCNAVSHWLGVSLESVLHLYFVYLSASLWSIQKAIYLAYLGVSEVNFHDL